MFSILCYVLSIAALFWAARNAPKVPQTVSASTLVSAILVDSLAIYCGSLFAGSAGLYTPVAVAASTITLLLLISYGSKRWFSADPAAETVTDSAFPPPPLSPSDWLLLLPAFILNASVPILLFHAVQSVFSNFPLAWDVQKYHLPFIVDSLQSGTLITSSIPYRSYVCGYELIPGFPSIFFRTAIGFTLFNFVSIIFLLASILWISDEMLRASTIERSWKNRMLVWLLATGFWSVSFSNMMEHCVGKADLFYTASILSMLAIALTVTRQSEIQSVRWLGFLLTAATALALAAKVYAAPYALIAVTGFSINAPCLQEKPAGTANRLRRALLMLAPAFMLGGFFMLRNVWAGYLQDSTAAYVGQHMNLVWLPQHPLALSAKLIFVAAILLLSPVLCLCLHAWSKRSGNQSQSAWLWTAAFATAAIISLPFMSLVYEDGQPVYRFLMPALMLGYLAISICIVLCAQVAALHNSKAKVLIASVLAVGAFSFVLMANKEVPIFRGFAGFSPYPSGLYRWMRDFSQPIRIYDVGTLPYYLYGRDWQNSVFFDPEASKNPERFPSVLRQFKPDVIAIDQDEFSKDSPMTKWIKSHPGSFTKVFEDSVSVALSVNESSCANIQADSRINEEPITKRF